MRLAAVLLALLLAGCLESPAQPEAGIPDRVRELVPTTLPEPPVPTVEPTPDPPTPTPPTEPTPATPPTKTEPPAEAEPRVILAATTHPYDFPFGNELQTWVRGDVRDLVVEATVLDADGAPREGTVEVREAGREPESCPSPCTYRAADPAEGLLILGVDASGTYRLRATVTVRPALRPEVETLYAVTATLDGATARTDTVYVLQGYAALDLALGLADGASVRVVDPMGRERLACHDACALTVPEPQEGRWLLVFQGAGGVNAKVDARLAPGTQPTLPDQIVVYDAWVDLDAGPRWDGWTLPADYIYHGPYASFSGKDAPPQGTTLVTFHTPRDTKGGYGLMRSVSWGSLGPGPASEDGLWSVTYEGSDTARAHVVITAFLRNPT